MGNKFNRIERVLAKNLNRFPHLKSMLKNIYSRINFFFFRKKESYSTIYEIVKINSSDRESFFGYYDKSPLNCSGNFLLYHEADIPTYKLPSTSIPIRIILKNLQSGKEDIFDSYCYNWQQGSRLQWIDDQRFIYNDYDSQMNDFCSIIVNANEISTKKKLSFPIYDVHGDYALSLNFSRLAILRPDYGYANLIKNGSGIDIYDLLNDGVFFCDLKQNKKELIITLDTLSQFGFSNPPKNAIHKVNHIMISPDGESFVFLHRFFINRQKHDRLFKSDKSGKNLILLADTGMISHYSWYDNKNLIVYMRNQSGKDNYHIINTESLNITQLGSGILDGFGDGHPSVRGDKVLFDTYPNRSRMKELYIYNLKSNVLEKIGEFLEPLKYSEQTRCDLHPRWANEGLIFIDSTHSGKRQLYLLNPKNDE
jgi:hypothetical protein